MPNATKDERKKKHKEAEASRKGARKETKSKAKGKAKERTQASAHSEGEPRSPKPARVKGKAKLETATKSETKPKKAKLTATNSDRYDLYQRSVNSPDSDVDFLIRAYGELRDGRRPQHLREDFCGTANLSAEWLARDPAFTAEGFDLDPEPIAWGQRVNFAAIDDYRERMTFHVADVRSRSLAKPDITTAPNFSYWCFRTREELKGYFRSALEGLARDGLFVIDVYGGPEALHEMEELRDIEGKFTYVWDQQLYWPGTGEYHAAIHFRFKDGSEMKNAFQYVWRFWNLTEIKDLLTEVGFRSVTTWFEGTDPEDEESGDGVFEQDVNGENCQAWIGYVVAAK